MSAKRGRKPKVIDHGEIASILAYASLNDDKAAAAEFKVSARTIQRWRADLRAGKSPEVAKLVAKQRELALGRNGDLLVETFDKALQALQKKLDSDALPGKELIEACKMLGELRQDRDFLNDGEPTPADERRTRSTQSPAGDEGEEGSAPLGAGGTPGGTHPGNGSPVRH